MCLEAQTFTEPNYETSANLGPKVGGNLFHRSSTFGLTGGETATFSEPASVTNVTSITLSTRCG